MGKASRVIQRYPLLTFLAVAMLCIALQLIAVDYQIGKATDHNWLNSLTFRKLLDLVLNHVADALILVMPFYLLPRRWRWIWWIVPVLLTVWCFAQFIYFPTYREIMPFSSFVLFDNVGDVVVGSTLGSLRWAHLEVVIPPVILLGAWLIWFRRPLRADSTSARRRWIWAGVSILLFILIRLIVTLDQYTSDDEEHDFGKYLYSQYCIVWNRHCYYYTANGFVPLAIHSAVTSLADDEHLSDEQLREVENYISTQPKYTDNTYAFVPADGSKPNLLLLVVESLNSWAVDLEIDGRKVAPTLDSLCHDSSAIVGRRMKTQVKNGRSSDGVFIYNTGLLPLMTKTVAMAYSESTYPALCHALKGYTSLYMCCDDPLLWNKQRMADNYGYDKLLSYLDYEKYLSGRYQMVDSVLLSNASDVIDSLKTPFAMMLTTTGMHSPYSDCKLPATWISRSKQYTPTVRNYLERLAYFDRQFKAFLSRLKRDGIYDNTLIVIVSDHSEFVDHDAHGRPAIDPEGDNCTLIVLNSGKGRVINEVFGQVDIYPTILDLMGANNYPWKGMGNSLMRTKVNSAATSIDEIAGERKSAAAKRQSLAWTISHYIITSRYFKNKKPIKNN